MAFAPPLVKTYGGGDKTHYQWGAKYIEKFFHLFLLLGFANFRRLVLSVFISFGVIIRPKIKSTIAATIPLINSISCGISHRKRLLITTPPITSLLKSSRYFPASSSRGVRFLGFFIASSAPIRRGDAVCLAFYDNCHWFEAFFSPPTSPRTRFCRPDQRRRTCRFRRRRR